MAERQGGVRPSYDGRDEALKLAYELADRWQQDVIIVPDPTHDTNYVVRADEADGDEKRWGELVRYRENV
jgi:hypothetical protein